MPDPGDRLALIEIVEAAERIRQYIAGHSRETFLADRKTEDAVTMQVFVVAEAAGRLGPAVQALFDQIDWRQVRGVRNRIAHGYGSLDFGIIWEIAIAATPDMASKARVILGDDPDLPLSRQ